jgi:23S rRNA (uracil1939-C5)-methyltransferase
MHLPNDLIRLTMDNQSPKKGYKYYPDVLLTEMHSGGRTISKIGNHNIYTHFGIPGEKADIEVKKHQKNGRYIIGSILNINKKSPDRVQPFCKHFGQCGGCNWQHINYEAQLKLKQEILVKALSKYGINTPPISLPIPSPLKTFYRNKLEYKFSGYSLNNKDNNTDTNILGFHPFNHPEQLVDIEECFLNSALINVICEDIRKFSYENNYAYYNFKNKSGLLTNIIFRSTLKKQLMIIVGFAMNNPDAINKFLSFLRSRFQEISSLFYFVVNDQNTKESNFNAIHFSGENLMNEYIEEFKFQISPFSFFQPNPFQAINIYRTIKEYAQLKGTEIVYDLYTGIGTIAIYLSKQAYKITGIEGALSSIEDARKNAAINNIKNTTFIKGDILETFTFEFVGKHGKPDLIILDPPRSGTLVEIKKTILLAEPAKIIYVSCNPVSLAWDLKQLVEKYDVAGIQPFDMFPHTNHLETLVLLTLRKSN